MSTELVAALAGAVIGAILTGALSFFQTLWSSKAQSHAERDRQRLALVREIMRCRLDQKHLVGPLNEIPLLFGNDVDSLRLYRETLNAPSIEDRTRSLSDLINRLALLVDLPSNVQASDVQRGFQYAE